VDRGTGCWRRNLPGGCRAAKDTCRLPPPRRAGDSAQRSGAGFLRSGGAGSRAIYASAHLRAGRRPWLATGGGREVVWKRAPGSRRTKTQGALRLAPAIAAVSSLQWRLCFPAPPVLGAPSSGRGGRGAGPTRSLQGPAAELSLPRLSGSQFRRVTPSPPVPGLAHRPCAPPPSSPPAPSSGSPPFLSPSSSHCSPGDTQALSTPNLYPLPASSFRTCLPFPAKLVALLLFHCS
jgi:hypothetical protein